MGSALPLLAIRAQATNPVSPGTVRNSSSCKTRGGDVAGLSVNVHAKKKPKKQDKLLLEVFLKYANRINYKITKCDQGKSVPRGGLMFARHLLSLRASCLTFSMG